MGVWALIDMFTAAVLHRHMDNQKDGEQYSSIASMPSDGLTIETGHRIGPHGDCRQSDNLPSVSVHSFPCTFYSHLIR